jgi:hypothetical protein
MNPYVEADADVLADNGGPPLLIEVSDVRDTAQDVLSAELADIQLRKVPITIVTGLTPRPDPVTAHHRPTGNEG